MQTLQFCGTKAGLTLLSTPLTRWCDASRGMDGKKAAWERFTDADWAGAREGFVAALELEPGDPEALDGLGQSLWWLGERDAGIERRREAYGAYKRLGDDRGAAPAGHLPGGRASDRRPGVRGGGLAGTGAAPPGLPGHDPRARPARDRGGQAVARSRRGRGHARAALEIAHELADPDVECMALAQLGRAAVRQGRVEEGVGLLDEAMTVALGGETSDPLACGDACCTTLVVCDGLADLRRAAEWCEAVVEFNERRHFTPVQSWCRSIYGAVLVRAGDWEHADAVLADALRTVPDRRRGAGRALPLAVLADLRLRQGRSEEANGCSRAWTTIRPPSRHWWSFTCSRAIARSHRPWSTRAGTAARRPARCSCCAARSHWTRATWTLPRGAPTAARPR